MTIRIGFLFIACFLFQSGNHGIAETNSENTAISENTTSIIRPLTPQEKSAKAQEILGKKRHVDPYTVSLFEERTYHITSGKYKGSAIEYRLFSPKKIDPKKKYPLILWLHGGGETGNDNIRQLSFLRHDILENQKEPFFILAPQLTPPIKNWIANFADKGKPPEDMLSIVISITSNIIHSEPIDPERVSIFGFGGGGAAAQTAAARRPDLFAAIVSCGARIIKDEELLESLSNVPAWFFHCSKDKYIRVNQIQTGLKKLGSYAHLTTYPYKGHNAWSHALVNDDALTWLAKQRKGEEPSWESKGPSKILWLLKEAGARFSALTVFVVLCIFLWRSYRPKKPAYS